MGHSSRSLNAERASGATVSDLKMSNNNNGGGTGGPGGNKNRFSDPLASLPKSHEKKYLPRQQTWASGQQAPTTTEGMSSSPSQSEYDTCDQADDNF